MLMHAVTDFASARNMKQKITTDLEVMFVPVHTRRMERGQMRKSVWILDIGHDCCQFTSLTY